jgi:hypothetical protein
MLLLLAVFGPFLAAVSLVLLSSLLIHGTVQRVLSVRIGRGQTVIARVVCGRLRVLGLRGHEAGVKLLEIARRRAVHLIVLRVVGWKGLKTGYIIPIVVLLVI